MTPVTTWFRSLFSNDRRKSKRHQALPVVAFYWDGAVPTPHSIRDIDVAGMFLVTEGRWYPNTLITMTLQRTAATESDPDRAIAVNARVVRSGADGVGFQFMLPRVSGSRKLDGFPANEADEETLIRFLARLRADAGSS